MFQTTNQYSNCSYLKCQFSSLNRDSQSNHQTNSLNHQPVMDCCGRWWSNVQAPKSPSDPLPPSIFHMTWHGVFRGSVRGWWKGWDMLMPSGELLGVYLYWKKIHDHTYIYTNVYINNIRYICIYVYILYIYTYVYILYIHTYSLYIYVYIYIIWSWKRTWKIANYGKMM